MGTFSWPRRTLPGFWPRRLSFPSNGLVAAIAVFGVLHHVLFEDFLPVQAGPFHVMLRERHLDIESREKSYIYEQKSSLHNHMPGPDRQFDVGQLSHVSSGHL